MYIGCNYLYYDTYGSYKYVILSIIDGTITYLINRKIGKDINDKCISKIAEHYFDDAEFIVHDYYPISNEVI